LEHSKTSVNRAGETLADVLLEILEGKSIAEQRRQEGRDAMEIVEWWRGEHARPLTRVAANLRHYAAKEAKPLVAQRLKKVPTIAHKLLREPGMKLARMGDIGGVRAVFPSQVAAYRVASGLRRNWTITSFKDYVAQPKPDGYRALHLINRHRGRLIEVQLRTINQDWWANTIERVSRATASNLKFGDGPPEVAEYFRAVAELLALSDQGNEAAAVAMLPRIEELRQRADTFL
jgi:putative GTP pyrophosphokinase